MTSLAMQRRVDMPAIVDDPSPDRVKLHTCL